jgi:hypothetical protein
MLHECGGAWIVIYRTLHLLYLLSEGPPVFNDRILLLDGKEQAARLFAEWQKAVASTHLTVDSDSSKLSNSSDNCGNGFALYRGQNPRPLYTHCRGLVRAEVFDVRSARSARGLLLGHHVCLDITASRDRVSIYTFVRYPAMWGSLATKS